jgi:hypothetical protein
MDRCYSNSLIEMKLRHEILLTERKEDVARSTGPTVLNLIGLTTNSVFRISCKPVSYMVTTLI